EQLGVVGQADPARLALLAGEAAVGEAQPDPVQRRVDRHHADHRDGGQEPRRCCPGPGLPRARRPAARGRDGPAPARRGGGAGAGAGTGRGVVVDDGHDSATTAAMASLASRSASAGDTWPETASETATETIGPASGTTSRTLSPACRAGALRGR